jgi:peptidoglycan/xylan/chitin deacetylase (PgdA/CDA1 family)
MRFRSQRAGAAGPLLVRQSVIGDFAAPAPRPTPTPDPVLHRARRALLPLSSVMRVHTHDHVLALTYDDGPEPAETADLLDVLAERGVCATFFVLTARAEAYPELIARMLREGHAVELHGVDHARLTETSGREAVRRIRDGKRRLEALTGRPVRYYRPTYGAISLGALIGARLLGMDIVIWSAWAEDWFDAPADEVADRAVRALHPGAVLLMHDTTDEPMAPAAGPRPTFSRAEVAARLVDGAIAGGYGFLTVAELLRRYPQVRSLTVQRPRLPLTLRP